MSERFPVLRVTGGPHGHGVQASLDGKPITGLVKMVLRVSHDDATYLYTKQIVELDIDTPVETVVGDVVINET